MKLTIERIENNIAVCEYTENDEIMKKEIPVSDIPFDVKEGTVFTAEETDGTWYYKLFEEDTKEQAETKKRVRGKLNRLFGRKKKEEEK